MLSSVARAPGDTVTPLACTETYCTVNIRIGTPIRARAWAYLAPDLNIQQSGKVVATCQCSFGNIQRVHVNPKVPIPMCPVTAPAKWRGT